MTELRHLKNLNFSLCHFETQWVTGEAIKTPARQTQRVDMIKMSINTFTLGLTWFFAMSRKKRFNSFQ